MACLYASLKNWKGKERDRIWSIDRSCPPSSDVKNVLFFIWRNYASISYNTFLVQWSIYRFWRRFIFKQLCHHLLPSSVHKTNWIIYMLWFNLKKKLLFFLSFFFSTLLFILKWQNSISGTSRSIAERLDTFSVVKTRFTFMWYFFSKNLIQLTKNMVVFGLWR